MSNWSIFSWTPFVLLRACAGPMTGSGRQVMQIFTGAPSRHYQLCNGNFRHFTMGYHYNGNEANDYSN